MTAYKEETGKASRRRNLLNWALSKVCRQGKRQRSGPEYRMDRTWPCPGVVIYWAVREIEEGRRAEIRGHYTQGFPKRTFEKQNT